MKRSGIRTNRLAKLLIFIVVLLLFGPFYWKNQSPDTKEGNRRKLHEFYQKELMAPCDETQNLCDKDLDDQNEVDDSEVPADAYIERSPLATFEDGVLGNFETTTSMNKTGPGEYGDPVETAEWDRDKADWLTLEYGFNMVTSDKIVLDRALPDTRLKECQFWHYPEDLPSASVIIVFHNEGWSTLLRTVHSVINTSSRHLLKEVILIDDYSDKEHLKDKLEIYLTKFDGLVKLYRNDQREGLIRSRTKGALLANAGIIVFLDAHCECNKNWLPPLLTRIANNRKSMAVPVIDSIDWDTFEYRVPIPGIQRWGIFEWSLLYKENILPLREEGTRRYRSEPYRSPTHAGGLFAMDKKYFFELGGYDPGLEIWGGENFELSFKIWQCGGCIEWVPCSRVGHVYKRVGTNQPESVNQKIPSVVMNYMRVVEVWFDGEYKDYFYRRQPWLYGTPLHNLQPQLDFRRKSNCKSFKWYMDNIAYGVTAKFPAPLPNVYWGQIRPWYTNQCWSFNGEDKVLLLSCLSRPYAVGQFFRLDVEGHLTTGEMCVLYTKDNKSVKLTKCADRPTGLWEYNKEILQMKNKDLNLCIEFEDDSPNLFLKTCNATLHNQRWVFKKIYMRK